MELGLSGKESGLDSSVTPVPNGATGKGDAPGNVLPGAKDSNTDGPTVNMAANNTNNVTTTTNQTTNNTRIININIQNNGADQVYFKYYLHRDLFFRTIFDTISPIS